MVSLNTSSPQIDELQTSSTALTTTNDGVHDRVDENLQTAEFDDEQHHAAMMASIQVLGREVAMHIRRSMLIEEMLEPSDGVPTRLFYFLDESDEAVPSPDISNKGRGLRRDVRKRQRQAKRRNRH